MTVGTATAAVTLGGPTTIATGTGTILVDGTLDGAQSLTLDGARDETDGFAGAVGGTTPLTA